MTPRYLWIGLHDRIKESVYQWVDGTVLNYTNWATTEPSGTKYGEENCVQMRFLPFMSDKVAGRWNDVPCNYKLEFICQVKRSKKGKQLYDPRFCKAPKGGWRFSKSCFHLVHEELSWSKAEKYCKNYYDGHLATINDSAARLFLEYILRNESKNTWIGIKIKNEIQQHWSSGWFVAYEAWAKDKGNFIYGTCTMRITSDEWTTVSCENTLPFICETALESPPTLPNRVDLFCPEEPEGWLDIGGEFCYYFKAIKQETWSNANFMCMRRGGTLVSIHSKLEHDVLQQFLIFHIGYWIGLFRPLKHEKKFIWTDGTPVNFFAWRKGEPNNENESCVEYKPEYSKWNDFNCNEERGYICSTRKIPLNKTVIVEPLKFCSNGLSVKELLGVIVCVSVVAVLLAVVVYNFRLHDPDHERSKKISSKLIPTPVRDQRPQYRSVSDIVVIDDTCEILS